jgi:hypothetical protein
MRLDGGASYLSRQGGDRLDCFFRGVVLIHIGVISSVPETQADTFLFEHLDKRDVRKLMVNGNERTDAGLVELLPIPWRLRA